MERAIPAEVFEDAEKINRGDYLQVDFQKYMANSFALTQLLTRMDVEQADGQHINLFDLRKMICHQSDRPIDLSQLHPSLHKRIQRALEVESLRMPIMRTALELIAKKEAVDAGIQQEDAVSFLEMTRQVAKYLGPEYADLEVTLAAGHPEEPASFEIKEGVFRWHADSPQTIKLISTWSRLRKSVSPPADQLEQFIFDVLGHITHEYAHLDDVNWTHQADSRYVHGFAWRQERLIEQLIRSEIDLMDVFLCTRNAPITIPV
jgi:hypothetical protein